MHPTDFRSMHVDALSDFRNPALVRRFRPCYSLALVSIMEWAVMMSSG